MKVRRLLARLLHGATMALVLMCMATFVLGMTAFGVTAEHGNSDEVKPPVSEVSTIYGSAGQGLQWGYDNGVLMFSSAASAPVRMNDYTPGSAPWYKYRSSIVEIRFLNYCPRYLNNIGDYAFYGLDNVTTITGATGLYDDDWYYTDIGTGAFQGCSRLTNMRYDRHSESKPFVLEGNDMSIGNYAFTHCGVTGVHVGGDTFAGNYAFYETDVTEVSFGGSVGYAAFGNCYNLKEVDLYNPDCRLVGAYAFVNCNDLQKVWISAPYVQLGDNAFTNCVSLRWIKVDGGLTAVGSAAFSGCRNMRCIWIDSQPPTFAADAFIGITTTVLYDADESGWAEITTQNYGGNLTWESYQPFAIIAQPQTTYTKFGCTIDVGVEATGNVLSYTWYHKDVGQETFSVSSVTGPTYSCKMSDAVKDRSVYCVIEDVFGAKKTTETVQLYMAATITKQPVNVRVHVGQTATVQLTAVGDELIYTWYQADAGSNSFKEDDTFTGDTYSVEMDASCSDLRVYCVVTDQYGNQDQSFVVTLSIAKPLVITTQPKTTYTKLNGTAKVTVKASGDGLTYTWYFKNASSTKFSKSSVTSATYSTKMTDKVKNRQVYCVIKDEYGNEVKTSTVYLRQAASIVTQPKTTYTKLNGTAKVTVKASGDGLTYTWYFKNAGSTKFSKSSITSATYSTKMTSTQKDRQVYCVVKDKYGKTVTTETVYLRQTASIVTQPKTTYTKLGGTAKVTVKASGDGLTYTWYFKNAGASKFSKSSITSATYTTKMTSTQKNRQVYCVVKDKYGNEIKTSTVYLRMTASIVTQPKTTYTKLNGTAKVTVKAAGDGLTYTWYTKNVGASKYSKSSVTSKTYSVKMTEKVKDRLVYCVIKDKYGNTVQTETVRLRMAASISKQPTNVTVAKGAKATVKLTAKGDGLTYKWYYKDADSKTFKLTTSFKSTSYSATMSKSVNGRQVYCVVTDKYGNSVKSNVVTLKMK